MSERTFEVPVAGLFCSRPAGDLRPAEDSSSWEKATRTPGPLTIRSDLEYQFEFHGVPDVTDPDFESLVRSLAGAPEFAALNLAGCEISDRAFKQVASLPALRSITFSRMTDRGLSVLSSLPKLSELNVEGSPITDRGLERLGQLSRLKSLSLRACPITDRGVTALAALTKLESIDLSGCPAVTDRGVAVLAKLANLHTVWMMGCWRITDRGIDLLAGMPVLKSAGLSQASGFLGRLGRKLGICGDARLAAFSPQALERLQEAHPNCDVSLEMIW